MVQFYEDGKIVVLNLACRKVKESHTANNIKKWIKEIQMEFEIKDEQILVLSADSAANMQKAAREYLKELIVKPFFVDIDDDDEEGDEEAGTEGEKDDEIDVVSDDEDKNEEEEETEFIPETFEYIDSAYLVACGAHQVQLAVEKFKKEKPVNRLLATARSLSAKLRTPQVRRLTEKENLAVAIMDQNTRWMSTFKMTERLVIYEEFCRENENLIKGIIFN